MLAPGRKVVGATVTLAILYNDTNGNDVDPTTVTFEAYSPSGITYTYVYGTDAEVVRRDTGDYYVDFVPDESGRWRYRWTSTGTLLASRVIGNFVIETDPWTDGTLTDAYRS